jgi:hypothetical protein
VPTDLSPFSQVWDIRFSNNLPISEGEETQYLAYLADGGRMFVMGENSGLVSRNDSVLSLIEAAGGGSLVFVTPTQTQNVVPPFDAPNLIPDGNVTYSAGGGVTSAGNGQFITVDDLDRGTGVAFGTGELANAPSGLLTAIFDVNFMTGFSDQPDSQSLLKNLITFVGGANLAPALALNPPGTQHTLTATVMGSQGEPLVGVLVTFTVLSGPNAGDEGVATTDENGMAQFTYTGDGGVGVDEIIATATDGEEQFESEIALKFWDSDCNNNDIADTCDIDEFGFGEICSNVPGAGASADEDENDVPDECQPTVHDPFTNLSSWPEAIQLSGDQGLAYVALQEDGFDIDSIAVLDGPSRVTLSNFTPTASECPDGFFADELALLEEEEDTDVVVSGGACGPVGVEVSDPENPGFIINAAVPFGLVEEVAIHDIGEETFIYAASYFQGLKIFSVDENCGTNSCTLTTHGSIGANDDWGAAVAIWLEEVDSKIIVYIAATNGLQIVDVSDPDNPEHVGSYPTNPDDIPLEDLDDVPQDVVVAGGYAYVPIWIGGLLVIDVSTEAKRVNPTLVQDRIPAPEESAFFKVEVSSAKNRIYVTAGLYGLAVFIQNPETGELVPEPETPRFTIGDESCGFDGNGVADICWAWAVDEEGELVAVSYGVLGPPLSLDGGYQLITQSVNGNNGEVLELLGATPVPEPHALILQGVGILALAGLGRLRRRGVQRRERSY